MEKFWTIIEGWRKYLILDPKVEKVALERLEICIDCDENTSKPKVTLSSRCKVCTCFLEAKTRVLDEECPLKLWQKYQQTENG